MLLQPEGWAMERWQYERLVEIVRPDAQRWGPVARGLTCTQRGLKAAGQHAARPHAARRQPLVQH